MRARVLTFGVIVALALVAAGAVARGQAGNWYPSRWGAADQRGAANRITPAKVLEAKNLITRGTIYQLGHVYETAMPMFGTRHYSLRIPQGFGPMGTNQTVYHDELVSGEIGQVGTQFDGLGHIGVGDLFYNGHNRREFAQAEGLTKLGIENVGAIVTRGVLIDVAGDIVLVHTGWGSLWIKDNAKFTANAPGIGLAAAQFLVDREVVIVGSDTWATEVVPNPNAALAFPVHQLLIPRNGIYIFENLVTEELAKDSVYEFAFFFAPLRLKGATGSPGNPMAIR